MIQTNKNRIDLQEFVRLFIYFATLCYYCLRTLQTMTESQMIRPHYIRYAQKKFKEHIKLMDNLFGFTKWRAVKVSCNAIVY